MEVTDYSKYRDVDGFKWPYVTHRERNGEVIFEIFANKVHMNSALPPKTFELPPGATILKKVNSRAGLRCLRAAYREHCHFGEEVWKTADFTIGLDTDSAFDEPAFFAAEEFEIVDG